MNTLEVPTEPSAVAPGKSRLHGTCLDDLPGATALGSVCRYGALDAVMRFDRSS